MTETTPEPDENQTDENHTEVGFDENEANGPEGEDPDRPSSFEPPA